ncbi:hypothetical protein LINGRAPRIM_LOCUS3231 [Linum grandiflorum]
MPGESRPGTLPPNPPRLAVRAVGRGAGRLRNRDFPQVLLPLFGLLRFAH